MSLFLANLIGWILEHKLITFLLLVIAFGGIYYACRGKGLTDEIRREQQGRSDSDQLHIDDAKKDVNISANVANQAMENLNKTANKDSSAYQPTEAENKFCERYKCDSSCAAWRKQRGIVCD